MSFHPSLLDGFFASAPPEAVSLEAARDPRQVLSVAVRHHPRIVLASALGPQSLALVDMLSRLDLLSDVDIAFLDTGLHFAETLQLKARVEKRYAIRIRTVKPAVPLMEQARRHGEELWSRDPSRCCALRKVAPMRELLAGYDAWITGIRRAQTPERAGIQPVEWDSTFELVKVNPLFAWNELDVERYLDAHQVPRNELREQGYRSIGCWPCTAPAMDSSDSRSGRWQGRTKTECGLHLTPADLEKAGTP